MGAEDILNKGTNRTFVYSPQIYIKGVEQN